MPACSCFPNGYPANRWGCPCERENMSRKKPKLPKSMEALEPTHEKEDLYNAEDRLLLLGEKNLQKQKAAKKRLEKYGTRQRDDGFN